MSKTINPYDGYRVFSITSREGSEVYATLRVGGELVREPLKLITFGHGDKESVEPDRFLYALTALCRYLNAGGDWWTLMDAVHGTSCSMSCLVGRHTLEFPPELECIGLTPDDSFQAYFHNTSTDTYLVVSEDCYCEEMSGVDFMGSFI